LAMESLKATTRRPLNAKIRSTAAFSR
jgi:hypothetical protein